MDDQTFESLKLHLKQLGGILVLAGLETKNFEMLTLGNTLSLTLACIDIGPDMQKDLMKAMAPMSEKVAAEIFGGNPNASHLNATNLDDIMKDGHIDVQALVEKAFTSKIDISDVLADGVHIQKEQNN